MTLRKSVQASAGCAVLLLALTGCGGDDNTASTPVTPTPPVTPTTPTLATAMASVSGLIEYMKLQVATLLDTAEPTDVTSFVPPTSDTTEPDAV